MQTSLFRMSIISQPLSIDKQLISSGDTCWLHKRRHWCLTVNYY